MSGRAPKSNLITDRDDTLVDDTSLRMFIGYNMKRAYVNIQSRLLQVLKPFDLRPTPFAALVLIVDNTDIVQSKLAEALGVKRSGVVLLVDELERRRFVSRNKVPGDRRAHALRATPAGLLIHKKILKKVRQHENEMFASFTQAQREQLNELLGNIEQIATNDPTKGNV